MSYLEHLKRCYMHSKNKFPDSCTKEEIVLHVLKTESIHTNILRRYIQQGRADGRLDKVL